MADATSVPVAAGYAIPIFFRVTTSRRTFKKGPVHLGAFSIPVAIVALLWVGFLTVLFVLPTVYPVTPANLNYAGVTCGAVLLFSMVWWFTGARKWFDGPETVAQGRGGLLSLWMPSDDRKLPEKPTAA